MRSIHAAAEIAVAGDTGPAGDANVEGVRNVVGQAISAGLDPVVYTSTVAVYLPSASPVITVDSPLAEPLSAYGRAKRDAEVLVREWQADGAPITNLVLGSVYGPQSPHLDGSFAALKGALEAFMAVTDGGMGIVDVRDLASVLVAALEPGRGPRRYLVGGHFLTWEEWTAALSEAVGRDVPMQRMTVDEMVDLGRQLDQMREAGPVDVPAVGGGRRHHERGRSHRRLRRHRRPGRVVATDRRDVPRRGGVARRRRPRRAAARVRFTPFERSLMASYPRDELEEMIRRFRATNDEAGRTGNWGALAEFYTEDALYTWNNGARHEFVARAATRSATGSSAPRWRARGLAVRLRAHADRRPAR